MSKKDYYIIEKNLTKIKRGDPTNFLDIPTLKSVSSKLKGYQYQIYLPYRDSDKVIIYTDTLPKIRLLEIISYDKLTHPQILGSLFGLNIDSEMFGDIIIKDNHYYILIIDSIYTLVINELKMIGNNLVKLEEKPLSIIENYQKTYQEITLIVTSLRIDVVVSRLIGISRDNIKKKFLNNDIVLNYELCHKIETNLKAGDIFSIRHYGKYRFGEIIGKSKKDNYIITCYKYTD